MGKHTNKKKKFPVWSRVIFIVLILLTVLAIGVSAWKKWSENPAEIPEARGRKARRSRI